MHTSRWLRPASCLAALLTASCGGCGSPVDEPNSTVPGQCQTSAPGVEPQRTDILFVIDNSGSMVEEQASIASELPAFIDELKKGAGVAQDFQVGVITVSVYQNAQIGMLKQLTEYPNYSGKLQPVPDLNGMPTTEKILNGDDPDLVEKFRRLVKQGTSGSGQETPFEAARLAVTPPLSNTPLDLGGNSGFLRDGARLLVVIVSDEDDCSEMTRPPKVSVGSANNVDYCKQQSANLTPVEDYLRVFTELKDSAGNQRPVLWAAIAPVGRANKEAAETIDMGTLRNVDCPTSFQPGFRQRQMAGLFDPSFQNLDSICRPSYKDSLIAIAQLANSAQSIEVSNIPDERLIKVELTRKDGTMQPCTLNNGGIRYEPANATQKARIVFQPGCQRRGDDTGVQVKLLCAG